MKNAMFIVFTIYFVSNCYINPVQKVRDSPDPGVLWDGHFYYAATTGGWDQKFFPIWKSSNLANWTQVGFGLVSVPAWVGGLDFWAP
jgi:beta-xylosidase